MDTLGQDLVYALRSLLRANRFTAMVVLTLALGIGANSAVFSVLDAVLLRPLPFTDADRVVNVSWDVTRLVIAQGIAPVLAGVLLGVVGAIGLSRVVAGFLWGVTATDPATLATVAVILLGVALAACWIPAREAANLEPVTALDCE